MKSGTTYRINGFEQIKAFYSWVFNNADKRITPQHISLYLFLINQGNRNNWVEWFKVPYDLGMTGACIGNKKTYYKCLADLSEWSMIQYEKGVNEWKAPLIKLEVLKSTATDTATVPLPEPLRTPQVVPLPIPLPTHIYKLLTDNIKPITDNLEAVLEFLKIEKENKPDYKLIIESYHSLCPRMARVQVLSDARKKYINARVGEFGQEKVIEVLRIAGSSDFLNGKNDKAWKADFEWIIRPENFIKVMEGKYKNVAKTISDGPKILTPNSI
jgi:hypothetical protein